MQAAIFSFTLVKIMPLNRALLPKGGVEKSKEGPEVRDMLLQWGRLHAVRTALGAVAVGASLYGLRALLASK